MKCPACKLAHMILKESLMLYRCPRCGYEWKLNSKDNGGVMSTTIDEIHPKEKMGGD